MRIAYIIHAQKMDNGTVRVIRYLTSQEDHVFLIINDKDDRVDASYSFSANPKVHVEQEFPYAQEGDLSLTRYHLLCMKKGLEMGGFKYFINLDAMMTPLKTIEEVHEHLSQIYPSNVYQILENNPNKKQINMVLKYHAFTNILSFPTNNFVRNFSKSAAFLLSLVGIKRKLEDKIVLGSQYFVISDQGAKQLVENIGYSSTHFKLSWYPEQSCMIMMLEKFCTQTHLNTSHHYVGPKGVVNLSSGARPLFDVDFKQLDVWFAGQFDRDTIKEILKSLRNSDDELPSLNEEYIYA